MLEPRDVLELDLELADPSASRVAASIQATMSGSASTVSQ